MKSRFVFSALAFLVVMTMTTTAFAQVFRLSSGTVSRGRDNGHAELTGNITLYLENGMVFYRY